MAKPTDPSERTTSWRLVGVGALLIVVGVGGTVFAWFPAPPHSTAAPLAGWSARWFAAGVGWFGLACSVAGVAGIRRGRGESRALRRAGCGAMLLAVVCWSAWLVSLLWR
jgi:hypothetical protein